MKVDNTDDLTLGDLFTIKRGLATGSNSFFIMDDEEIKEWHIPRRFLKPILPGPRYLRTDIIEPQADEAPAVFPGFTCLIAASLRTKSRPPGRISTRICTRGVSRTFTCRISPAIALHGTPRSSVPRAFLVHLHGPLGQRQASVSLYLESFGCNGAQRLPNALSEEPPAGGAQESPGAQAKVFEALQRIETSQIISEGRVYGGGLHKVEPRELAQIPARLVLENIDAHVRIERQERLFV